MTTVPPPQTDSERLESDTMRQVSRRLIPLVMLLFLIAYIDRSNIAVASLTMNDDIGLSASAYGFGAGIFFVTYIIFEVPSNVALARLGARRWIARIMISWGVVAMAMALIQGPTSFYGLRLMLGAAEAGFTPGIIFYLSLWFPARHRARAMALFYVGSALATAVGAPLSGVIVKLDGLAGLYGWQWLFLIEGLPAIVVGFVVLRVMTDRPADASWLPRDRREWLTSVLRTEREALESERKFGLKGALTDPGILLLALFLFLYSFNSIGLTLWMPQVIEGTFGSPSDFVTALLTALPYALATVFMLFVARNLRRHGKAHLHMAIPMAVGGVLLALSGPAGANVGGFLLLAVSTGIAWSVIPALWDTATSYMTGVAAAAGVALINALANVAGLAVTPLIGRLRDATGSFSLVLYIVAAAMLLGAVVALVSHRYTRPGRLAREVQAQQPTGLAGAGTRPEPQPDRTRAG